MIEIIPAIDIIDGRCVRLTRGDYSKVRHYDASPADMAAQYADIGVKRIHAVDLDGAKVGKPVNLRTLEKICSACGSLEIEWGGGVSSDGSVNEVFSAGADCAIIGSIAVRKPELMQKWLECFGGDKIILGADLRDGYVAVKGWIENSALSADSLVGSLIPYGLKNVICTDISKDGMLQGPSFGLYSSLQSTWPDLCFTASGGISCMDDIAGLQDIGIRKVIVGKAIYEGRITLEDIRKWLRNE